MLFLVISVVVPLAVYTFLPFGLKFLGKGRSVSRLPLVLGGIVFFLSWYIPSPLIQGQDTQFMTHLVGGGIFSGFVWFYIKQYFGLKMDWKLEIVSLYAVVSSLGVANELFELLVVQRGFVRLSPMDTWWDLLANSLGAFLFWLGYRFFMVAQRRTP